ncbi:MAG: hypothetical protein N3D16_02465 [Anaerolineales bacterium]|nr:hypothetical protein [Anaerolineales bacterium]
MFKSRFIEPSHKLISSSEWRWVFVYAVLVMMLTLIPYMIAFQKALPQDQAASWRFSGFFFGVEDGNSYIAKMRRGMEGEWLFRSPYSSMEQKGVLAFLPYYLLGKLAGGGASHEQLVVLFHWFRFGAGIFCIFATYRLICDYLTQSIWRQVALVLITLGGGLGWVVLFFPNSQVLPLEFYSPEAFGFLSLYGLPHLSLARAFMLLAIIEYISLWEDKETSQKIVYSWRLSCFWLCAGLSQPIHAAILSILIAIHLVFIGIGKFLQKSQSRDWKGFWRNIIFVFMASSPALALVTYTGIRFLTDPYLKIWAAQNRLPAAPISLYLLSYGWLIPFVFGGINKVLRDGTDKHLLLLVWLCVALTLILTPISIQRRLIEGVWVVIVLLSTTFLESLDRIQFKPMLLRGLRSLLLFCALPPSLLLIWGGSRNAISPKSPIFIPEQDAIGYETLNRFEIGKDAIVLASYETSNALPAYAFVRVVIGHGPESPFVDRLSEKVREFYQEQAPNVFRWDFIRQHQIQYVIWGENEKNLGAWQPALETYLKAVYENEGLVIFEVDWTKMEN